MRVAALLVTLAACAPVLHPAFVDERTTTTLGAGGGAAHGLEDRSAGVVDLVLDVRHGAVAGRVGRGMALTLVPCWYPGSGERTTPMTLFSAFQIVRSLQTETAAVSGAVSISLEPGVSIAAGLRPRLGRLRLPRACSSASVGPGRASRSRPRRAPTSSMPAPRPTRSSSGSTASSA